MITAWTKHISDQEEKQRFETSLLHSKWAFEHLASLLTDMEKDLDRNESSPRVYDLPNWDYRQAHSNGFRQGLGMVKKLITLDLKETNDQRKPTTT